MADVKIKLSLDGTEAVVRGLGDVGEKAEKSDGKLKAMVSGGLKAAGAALVGFGVAAAGAGAALAKGVIGATADYEQNIGGIETLFKESSGKMAAYAASAYKTSGLSANEYMSQVTSFSASLISGLGGDTDKAASVADKAMIDMSDNANKFGSNIADIQRAYQGFAKNNYGMLDNLKLGYGGTAQEMARLINDSKVMGDTFVATASNINEVPFDKVIEGIHQIQSNLDITGTTAAEAEQTIAGAMTMLSGSWANLLAGLGTADADVGALVENVLTSFELVVTNIAPVIKTMGSHIAELGPQLGSMMSGLVETITAVIPDILMAGIGLVEGFTSAISSALPGLVTALVPGLIALVDSVATVLPQLIDAGAQAVNALISGLAQGLPQMIPAITMSVVGMVDAIVKNLPTFLQAGLELILGLADGIIAAIPPLLDSLPALIDSVVAFLLDSVPAIIQAGVTLLTSLTQALPQVITQLSTVIPQIVTSLIQAITTSLPVLITSIVEAIPPIIEGLVTAIVTSIPILIDAGIQLLMSLITALPDIIDGLVAAIPQIIDALLTALVNATPQLIAAGVTLIVSLVQNLPAIIKGVLSAIPRIVSSLTSAITGSVGAMAKAGLGLLIGIVGSVGSAIPRIVGVIPSIISSIVTAIGGGLSAIAGAGYNLITGLWSGMSRAGGWLKDKLFGWASGIVNSVKSAFGIASPSKLMALEVGQHLPTGLVVGIERTASRAIGSMRSLRDDLISEISIPHFDIMGARSQPSTSATPPSYTGTPAYAPSYSTSTSAVTNSGPLVHVQHMEVRSDQDITRLAQKLSDEIMRNQRTLGRLAYV